MYLAMSFAYCSAASTPPSQRWRSMSTSSGGRQPVENPVLSPDAPTPPPPPAYPSLHPRALTFLTLLHAGWGPLAAGSVKVFHGLREDSIPVHVTLGPAAPLCRLLTEAHVSQAGRFTADTWCPPCGRWTLPPTNSLTWTWVALCSPGWGPREARPGEYCCPLRPKGTQTHCRARGVITEVHISHSPHSHSAPTGLALTCS